MRNPSFHISPSYFNKEHQKIKRISALLTAIIGSLLFLFLYTYRFIKTQKEENLTAPVTAMLLNFGDNQQDIGNGTEEPAPVELAGSTQLSPGSFAQERSNSPATITEAQPTTSKEITGISTNRNTTKPSEKKSISSQKKVIKGKKSSTTNSSISPEASKAIGNFISGKGKSKTGQGSTGTPGNAGDPRGGDSDGNSTVGEDRKLIGFIPGTLGRGGSLPNHSCDARGQIIISYVVDASGRVVSAKKSRGISDPCVVQTTTSWVRRYVRAERATHNSSGQYTIKFQ